MTDPRIMTLAKNLVNYSCNVQKGEKVLIENFGLTKELVLALIDEVYAAGGYPFVSLQDYRINRSLIWNASKEQFDLMASYEAARMKEMDAYIGIRAGDNVNELSDVPANQMQMFAKYVNHPVHTEIRIPHTKWVVLRYPTPSMAQLANMSTAAFEDFYFDVCNLDYAKMSKAMDALVALMDKTDEVHIVGSGTDLKFSIKDIPTIKSAGNHNIPDGEVFTAPVRDSVNGKISYNAPSPYQGFTFRDVVFEFKDGKIVSATANDTKRINEILDSDEVPAT